MRKEALSESICLWAVWRKRIDDISKGLRLEINGKMNGASSVSIPLKTEGPVCYFMLYCCGKLESVVRIKFQCCKLLLLFVLFLCAKFFQCGCMRERKRLTVWVINLFHGVLLRKGLTSALWTVWFTFPCAHTHTQVFFFGLSAFRQWPCPSFSSLLLL